MTDPTRDLIQRLVDIADTLDGRKPLVFAQGQAMDGFTALANFQSLADEARAYLAQPEPEGPTDEPLGDLIDEWVQEAFRKKPYGCKHPTHTYVACKAFEHGRNHSPRALLSSPRPAVKPVPVSERMPGEGDCDPSFQCWWFTPSEEKWILWPIKWAGPECSHWLPHYALPVPTTTETP